MKPIFSRASIQIIAFLLLEILSIAMGMGVPFFTILYGFLVGLILPQILRFPDRLSTRYLASLLRLAFMTSLTTFVLMAVLWLPALSWLSDPTRDLTNFGMPLILYTPYASFVGWIVLMVLISPFLQFLMTVFGSIVRVVFHSDRKATNEKSSGTITES